MLPAEMYVKCVVVGHASGLEAGDVWWLAWNFDPLIAFNIGAAASLYALGLRNAWQRAGRGRIASVSRSLCFFIGLMILTVALMSPLDVLSNDLSWVHMIQHMALMVVAAPLIMFGTPGIVIVWVIPQAWRKRVLPIVTGSGPGFIAGTAGVFQRWLWNPFLVWWLHALGLWVWHIPWLYELALVDPLVHDVEHLTFFVVACLFWRVVIDSRRRRIIAPGLAVLYLFTTSIQTMFLGVFMALSPTVWYPIYAGRTERWGLKLLEDQQLAGMIMWMPACTTYVIVAIFLFIHWIDDLAVKSSRNWRASDKAANRFQLGS